ncbi:MAG: CoB--CoM heterodisulfide reductase subunit B [Candidatus Methanomethylophilaceae archaeon]|jgi:heterodisulfide reductase subunit B|nr:CoB--CoM heterodisulfide reductase subunit B [Candidatus Methanomethylophilaceae archaeon]
MAKYAFFLGCIAPLRYPGVEKSTRDVCTKLGIELVDLKDASCCPAPGVIRAFSKETWIAAAARNLALAEKEGLDILTICNGCYGSLFDAAHELHEDPELLARVNKILAEIGMEYKGTTKVRHFAEVIYRDIGLEKVKEAVTKPLDYQVATFYGCHFLKPSKIKSLDDPENPRMLDDLVEAVGAKSMPRKQKLMCCGAGGGLRSAFGETAMKFTKENLDNIKESGAQYIIDVCPFCHLQFDQGQKELGYSIPVLHLAQLYGVAMGMDAKDLGLSAHATPVKL